MPLDPSSHEIRLLILAPSEGEKSEISCDVEICDLDASPDYEALSYTWGDWIDPGHIYVDGWRFDITRNLRGAYILERPIGCSNSLGRCNLHKPVQCYRTIPPSSADV